MSIRMATLTVEALRFHTSFTLHAYLLRWLLIHLLVIFDYATLYWLIDLSMLDVFRLMSHFSIFQSIAEKVTYRLEHAPCLILISHFSIFQSAGKSDFETAGSFKFNSTGL